MFTLNKGTTGLLVIDVQEKIFRTVERPMEILHTIQMLIKGLRLLSIPVYISEQYPAGLGNTIEGIREVLPPNVKILSKKSFSCLKNQSIRDMVIKSGIRQWILVGLEAHVCVLQTAKDFKSMNFDVVVLNDAVSSRSLFDFSTAVAEMKDEGIRISSTETVLFELFETSENEHFKALSELLK